MSKFSKINKPQLSAIAIAMTLALSGCGGGGVDSLAPQPDLGIISVPNGSSGGGDGGSTVAAVNISDTPGLEDNNGPTNTITNNGATATIMVLDAKGLPIPNIKVVFTGEGLEYIDSADGSTLTGANGIATMRVKPAQNATKGAFDLTATVTNSKGESVTTGIYNYILDPTILDGNTIPNDPFNISNTVGLENNSGSPTRYISGNGAIAKVKVTNEKGEGIGGVKVTFSGEGLEYVSADGSALTTADGWATMKVVPIKADKGGTGQLTATAFSGDGKEATTAKAYFYTYYPDPVPVDCSANTAEKHIVGCPIIKPDDPNNPDPVDLSGSLIYIESSSPTLKTGSDRVELTVRVTDQSGGILAGVPVKLKLDNPGATGLSFETSSSVTTDSNGLVTVGLKQSKTNLASRLNHVAEVTVNIVDTNDTTTTATIDVVGTEVISVTTKYNTDTSSNTFNVEGILVDGTGIGIANTQVAIVNNDNQIKKIRTDLNGKFSFPDIQPSGLTITDSMYSFDLAVLNDSNTVLQTLPKIVEVAEASQTIAIEVNDIIIGENGTVTVKIANADGKPVTLSTNKGEFSGGESSKTKTISGGKATFTLSANVSGVATLEAKYNNGTEEKTNTATLDFLSVNPAKLSAQVKRSEVAVNASTELVATVLDDTNTPVKNANVEFSLIKDSSGGRLSKGSVLTDKFGKATLTYTAGQNPTASKGVKIRAKVTKVILPNGTEKTVNVNPDFVNLTVQTTSSSLAFGLADKMRSGPREVYYFRNASLFVTNNAGQPAGNQEVSIALRPKKYFKGSYSVYQPVDKDGKPAGDKVWTVDPSATCTSEDALFASSTDPVKADYAFNSILDPGEDINGSLKLESGYDATILVNGNEVASVNGVYNLTTDSAGKADFEIRHLKEYAEWFTMDLEATTRVDGSESSQKRPIDFPVLANDVKFGPPPIRPNWDSPYGVVASCTSPN